MKYQLLARELRDLVLEHRQKYPQEKFSFDSPLDGYDRVKDINDSTGKIRNDFESPKFENLAIKGSNEQCIIRLLTL